MASAESKAPTVGETAGAQGGAVEALPGSFARDSDQKEPTTPRIGMVTSPDVLPAVGAYLRRVGASVVNFKTAKVEETAKGYPRRAGTISFDIEGSVKVTGRAEPPTTEEQEAIKRAFIGCTFPKLVTLAAIAEPPEGVSLHDLNTFVCHDFAGQVALVQKRYDNRDGTKGFLAYTRWSDGQWRVMEPDILPFFGLPGWQDHSTLFIHEGAGAAARVKRIIANEEQADFPWREEMRWGHHVGWIGGVFALRRSWFGKRWPVLTLPSRSTL